MSLPEAFGYFSVGASAKDTELLQQEMTAFAESRNYRLSHVFIETEDKASSAYAALIDAVRAYGVTAVLVPSLDHFGHLPGVGLAMRQRIEDETGARVIITEAEGKPRSRGAE